MTNRMNEEGLHGLVLREELVGPWNLALDLHCLGVDVDKARRVSHDQLSALGEQPLASRRSQR